MSDLVHPGDDDRGPLAEEERYLRSLLERHAEQVSRLYASMDEQMKSCKSYEDERRTQEAYYREIALLNRNIEPVKDHLVRICLAEWRAPNIILNPGKPGDVERILSSAKPASPSKGMTP